MRLKTLDHVALWVADRPAVVRRAIDELDVRVIEETDRFTLLGADARRGKLTFFDAQGPREAGALVHIGLRVARLGGERGVDLGEGLHVRLVEAPTDVDYDLDHVALRSRDPAATARAYRRYGFVAVESGGAPRAGVGGAHIEFHRGEPGDPERPLLNHLGVLVDSAEEHRAEAEAAGIEIADLVDAPNTIAVFVWLPERVKLEYIEHKPTFSLA